MLSSRAYQVDFRRQLRSTAATGLKVTASNAEMDTLFDAFSGGGAAAVATVSQVHSKLWSFAKLASVADPQVEEFMAAAEACREEAKLVQVAIDAVHAYEEAAKKVPASGADAPVVAQLGTLVQKRNMKVGEVIAKWGDVDHAKFRHHVWELGVVATAEAIDAVFDEIDDDGGGTLDADELKDGMKLLIESAKANASTQGALEKQANSLRKAAMSQVVALHKKELQRQERLAREAEAARQAEEARLVAEAEAARLAEEAKAEAAAKKKAEREALLAQMAAAKAVARGDKMGIGGKSHGAAADGAPGAASQNHVAQWKKDAAERKRAENNFEALKKTFKRKWKPPGLSGPV